MTEKLTAAWEIVHRLATQHQVIAGAMLGAFVVWLL
jgi:hypothetical protein